MKHPITPPPELAAKWVSEIYGNDPIVPLSPITLRLVERAAQWGADQELEACCDWVETECPGYGGPYEKLRAARRPKPPSLKEQALALLEVEHGLNVEDLDLLRRALEQIDD